MEINTVFQRNEFPAADTQRDREKGEERKIMPSKVRLYVIRGRNGNNNW